MLRLPFESLKETINKQKTRSSPQHFFVGLFFLFFISKHKKEGTEASRFCWMASLFTLTERLKSAISLINTIDVRKLVHILQRVIKVIHSPTHEAPFTPEEQEKLPRALNVNATEAQSVLDSCSLLFEQAAYFSLSVERLQAELEAAGIGEQQIAAFAQVWELERDALLEKLSNSSVVPQVLDGVNWRLHVAVARNNDTSSPIAAPRALFELKVKDNDHHTTENVHLEFTQEELFSLFNKLEAIQEQLDALG